MTRRVLFCTIGQTPQVVTETVWALMNPGEKSGKVSWRPDEVHIITTSVGLPRVRESLQSAKGPLATLFKGKLPPVTVYVPKRDRKWEVYGPPRPSGDWDGGVPDGSSRPAASRDTLADVNSEKDAAIMGDVILQLTASFVQHEDSEIHVSLAGGRKTMSAHALLAISLVGRPQDKASHVLVSPIDYEDNREFWHPSQEGGPIRRKLRTGEKVEDVEPTLDPQKADVMLVETPAPLMRYQVKDLKAVEKLQLVDLIREYNAYSVFSAKRAVRLLTAKNAIVAGDVEAALSAKLFAFYRLIAMAQLEKWPGAGPEGIGPTYAGWLTVPQICFGKTSDGKPIDQLFLRILQQAVQMSPRDNDTTNNKSIKKWKAALAAPTMALKRIQAENSFGPNMTNLQKELVKQFGPPLAGRLATERREGGDCLPVPGLPPDAERTARFGLNLPSASIEIV
jgi:CRISPR-associated protein (TIGR02584 family)